MRQVRWAKQILQGTVLVGSCVFPRKGNEKKLYWSEINVIWY